MLVIRLRRIGKKSQPSYRIVVAEHTTSVNGSFVSDLGFYNPHSKQVSIKKDEATDWMNKGAKPSNTVAKLLEKEKIKHKSVVVTKFKKAPKKKTEEKEKTAPAAAPEVTETSAETVTEGETPSSEVTENADETAPAEAVAEDSAPAKENEAVETSAKTSDEPAA